MGLAASLACSAAFFVFAAVLAATRRSAAPPTLPAMSVLGPQTPAVANLLANGGTVTPDAVDGPLFVTLAVYVVLVPVVADDGAVTATARSALAVDTSFTRLE